MVIFADVILASADKLADDFVARWYRPLDRGKVAITFPLRF